MNFGIALEKLKRGEKVCRAGWNGKGMWIALVGLAHQEGMTASFAWILTNPESTSVTEMDGLPWIGMKTADNKFVPWLASQTDILAEDWESVP